jgi:hypothetical protein
VDLANQKEGKGKSPMNQPERTCTFLKSAAPEKNGDAD